MTSHDAGTCWTATRTARRSPRWRTGCCWLLLLLAADPVRRRGEYPVQGEHTAHQRLRPPAGAAWECEPPVVTGMIRALANKRGFQAFAQFAQRNIEFL